MSEVEGRAVEVNEAGREEIKAKRSEDNLRGLWDDAERPALKSGLPWQLSWWRIRLQCRRPQFSSWVRKICWRRDRLPTPVFLSFPGGSAGKESACNAWDLGLIPGLGRSPGEGIGCPLQCSYLENSMDRGAWQAAEWGCKETDTTEWLSLIACSWMFKLVLNINIYSVQKKKW